MGVVYHVPDSTLNDGGSELDMLLKHLQILVNSDKVILRDINSDITESNANTKS